MKPLNGSRPQVVWANQIREKVLSELKVEEKKTDRTSRKELINKAITWLADQTDATMWIDNRDKSIYGWLVYVDNQRE